HGWAFRAVFRQDRKGNLLDLTGRVVPHPSNKDLVAAMRFQHLPPRARVPRDGVPLHLMDVHMEKGMHCVDCHFVQDNHGNTRLQMEVRAAVEIQCIDCHGTITKEASLRTSGPAAYTSTPGKPWLGRDLAAMRTPYGKPRFERRGGRVYQNSMVEKDISWEVVQSKDTINPAKEHYNPKAALAKTARWEGDKLVWGN